MPSPVDLIAEALAKVFRDLGDSCWTAEEDGATWADLGGYYNLHKIAAEIDKTLAADDLMVVKRVMVQTALGTPPDASLARDALRKAADDLITRNQESQ